MSELTHYLNWVLHEAKPAAETYADDFFQHMALTLDERANQLIDSLDSEDSQTTTRDLTVPVINATILESMAAHCIKAAQGWRDIYTKGLNEHFPPGE
jgi:hypothetical protein